jgi:hypothetical protein
MKYLISYTTDRYFDGEDGVLYRPEGRTMIVEAESKIKAFVLAYQELTDKGYMVRTLGDFATWKTVSSDGSEYTDLHYAGLSSDEMNEVYKLGVPQVSHGGETYIAMTHIKNIQPHLFNTQVPTKETKNRAGLHDEYFVDPTRIEHLKSLGSAKFDLSKLIELCNELNRCWESGSFLAVAMLMRSIMDHVPPIFGYSKFAEISNNYGGTKSFKKSMEHLENSLRNIADAHLHTSIRQKEVLPTKTQVNFANDLDVLLAEIVRILK